MTIIGIDPGFSCTGYCVAQKDSNKIKLLDYGTLKMKSTKSLIERVGIFNTTIKEKIEKHSVDSIALETSFLGKNAQSFLKLGYLRGCLYLMAGEKRLELFEYSPAEVKKQITGHGRAEKDQMARFLKIMFPSLEFKTYDTTDAIAIALCGLR